MRSQRLDGVVVLEREEERLDVTSQNEGHDDERTDDAAAPEPPVDGAPGPEQPVEDAAGPEPPVAPKRPRGGRMAPLTDARRDEVVALRAEGKSLGAIARQLGMAKSTVGKAVRRAGAQRTPASEARSPGGPVEKVDAELGAAAAGVPVDDAVTEATQAARVVHLERLEAEDRARTLMAQAAAADTEARMERLADLRVREREAASQAAQLVDPRSDAEREEFRLRTSQLQDEISQIRESRHAMELEASETRHRQELAAHRQETAAILRRLEDRPSSDGDMSFWRESLDKIGEGIGMIFAQVDRRIDKLAESGQLPAIPPLPQAPALPKLEALPQVDWSKQSDEDMKGYGRDLGVEESDPKAIRAELTRRQKKSLEESREAAGQIRAGGYRSL